VARSQTIDVSQLIDERKINGFNVLVVVLCFFITMLDGYDITAVSFAAPTLIKEWGLTNMAAFGPVLSASLAGIFFGSLIFGYIGDRWGRKFAIIWSSIAMGVFTLAAVWANDLATLAALRFLAGIGIGGLLPNSLALNAEFAPRRARATMVIVMFTGITFGGAIPGFLAAWLLSAYGWQSLFVVGGVLPLVIAAVTAFWLPESVKYLVLKTNRRAEVAKIVSSLEPTLPITADTQFVVPQEQSVPFTPALLFSGGLFWLTILLWILVICNQMAFYFVNSWLPTVLTSANVPLSHAVIANALFQVGGTIGGLVLARPMDKYGMVPVCILFVLSIFAGCSIGYAREPEELLMTVVFLAGFTLLGTQLGLNAVSTMIYPTSFRSSGAGWALAVSRFGAVVGPIVGGVLISWQLPIEQLYLFLLLPLGVGSIASFIMARLYYLTFHGLGLERQAAPKNAIAAH